MSTTASLAIVVPVFNVERYLRECLDSFDIQTDCRFDVYAVDDGSTDRSGLILDEYAATHNWLHVFHKENGGASSARNAALDVICKERKHKYVSFVDPDDYVSGEYVARLIHSMEQANLDIVFFGLKKFDMDSSSASPQSEYRVIDRAQAISEYIAALGGNRTASQNISFCTKVLRLELLNNLRYDRALVGAEDIDLAVRVLDKVAKGAVIPDILYFYRMRKSSQSHSNYRSSDEVKVFESILDRFSLSDQDTMLIRNKILKCKIYELSKALMNGMGREEFKAKVTDIHKYADAAHLLRGGNKTRMNVLGYGYFVNKCYYKMRALFNKTKPKRLYE